MASKAGEGDKESQGFFDGLRQQLADFKVFLWDPTRRTVLGRNAKSWGEVGLFYLIFYSCLACFFAITLIVFYQTLSWEQPTYWAGKNYMNIPSVGFRPNIRTEGNIAFNPTQANSYDKYIKQLDSYLAPYNNVTDDNYVDCTSSPAPLGKLCKFDTSQLGPCATSPYGYDQGKPCILLKFNRAFGWEPVAYKTVPDNLAAMNFTNGAGTVLCKGKYAPDRNALNQDDISYFPREFSPNYFPFRGHIGGIDATAKYLSPLIAAQFNNVTTNRNIRVLCEAFSGNIKSSDRTEDIGRLQIDLRVSAGAN
ncbi:sodium/potassium-transporting ATPase subunit beta-3-like [Branchiostoma lanceolatum]|uniref:sodium/potassium-transporting ATPase subunit beta-3-like n=1 Tax=Branchiostoma lanceolatum TaxID=7740 RepID=UPI003453C271